MIPHHPLRLVLVQNIKFRRKPLLDMEFCAVSGLILSPSHYPSQDTAVLNPHSPHFPVPGSDHFTVCLYMFENSDTRMSGSILHEGSGV